MGPLGWYKSAWDAYRSNFFAMILTIITIFGIGILPTILLGFVFVVILYLTGGFWATGVSDGSFGLPLLALFLFGSVFAAILSGYILAFKILAFREALRGKPNLISSLRAALKYFPSMLCLVIAYGIYILLGILVLLGGAFLIAYAVATSSALWAAIFTLALVFFALFALWIFVRITWAPVYIISNGLGVLGALQKSWVATGVQLGKAIKGYVSLVLMSLVSVFVAHIPFVGDIFVVFFFEPLWNLVFVAVAEDLGNESTA